MAQQGKGSDETLVLVGARNGVTLIPASTPLTRLNYYDGKFLRAADLQAEQSYLRQLVALSNQGGGPGVVHGLDTTLGAGDTLKLGPGLAIDPGGRVLLLPQGASLNIQELIEASRTTRSPSGGAGAARGGKDFSECEVLTAGAPTVGALPANTLYLIVLCHAEALCGQEDVYGRLCEEACVTARDRPYRLEGLVVRALPLTLRTPLATSNTVTLDPRRHLRSRVASAYFEDERREHPHAIRRDGLLSDAWCLGAGYEASGCEVPLAVLARAGSTTLFLDAWTARRERMEAPARRFWAWRMRMRPWDVFLAQVLQFQCQLAQVLEEGGEPGGGPQPCQPERELLAEATRTLESLQQGIKGLADNPQVMERLLAQPMLELGNLQAKLKSRLGAGGATPGTGSRILLSGGIVELPPAGYLPVVVSTTVTVNQQVRALLGPGVDLRFCIVRPDYVAHALEEAQHLERISLLEGLDDPTRKPQVDILVPDGLMVQGTVAPSAQLFDATLDFSSQDQEDPVRGFFQGAAREELLASGGAALYTAGSGQAREALESILESLQVDGKRQVPEARPQPGEVPRDERPTESTRPARPFNEMLRTAAASARPLRPQSRPLGRLLRRNVEPSTEGYWLTVRCEKDLTELPRFAQSQVSGRFVMAHFGEDAGAIDAGCGGVFTVTRRTEPTSRGGLRLEGVLHLNLSLAALRDAERGERGTLFNLRQDLIVELVFPLDVRSGTVTLDLSLPEEPGRVQLRLQRTQQPHPPRVLYQLLTSERVRDDNGNESFQLVPFGRLAMRENVEVARPSSSAHQLAEAGLDIIQAVLDNEPTFKPSAELALFPPLPPAGQELTVQAVQDWVLFHRRRPKQCTQTPPEQPQPQPPRRYQLFEHTVEASELQDVIEDIVQHLEDPSRHGELLERILLRARGLPIEFESGSSRPRFDPTALALAWKQFQPGGTIGLALVGSQGDDSAALQQARLTQVESAISADSRPDAETKVITPVPFPEGLTPPGAEGLMLLVTSRETQVECQEVYTVPISTNGDPTEMWWDAMRRLILSNTPLDDLPGRMEALGVRRLERLDFQRGTSNVVDASVQALTSAYDSRFQEQRAQRMAVWRGTREAQLDLRLAQANAMLTVLPPRVATSVQLETWDRADVLPPCPSIVFLGVGDRTLTQPQPSIRTARLVVLDTSGGERLLEPTATLTWENGNLQRRALEGFARNRQLQQLTYRGLTLAARSGPVDAQAASRVREVTEILRAGGLRFSEDRQRTEPLSDSQRRLLRERNIAFEDVDDILFLEGFIPPQ